MYTNGGTLLLNWSRFFDKVKNLEVHQDKYFVQDLMTSLELEIQEGKIAANIYISKIITICYRFQTRYTDLLVALILSANKSNSMQIEALEALDSRV